MVDWSSTAYAKQISLYIKNRDFGKAVSLAEEFVEKNPGDMMANFMMARAAFWSRDIKKGIEFGHKAFNLASSRDDLVLCGILLASIYYLAERYKEGYSLLESLKAGKNEEAEKLMILFSIAMKDEAAAQRHIASLYEINARAVIDVLY